MGFEAKAAELKNIESVVFLAAAATLTPDQRVVRLDSTGAAFTVTLPPVVECFDKIYTFRLTAGANIVTVAGGGDEEAAYSDNHMNAAGEALAVYSDGRQWITLATV